MTIQNRLDRIEQRLGVADEPDPELVWKPDPRNAPQCLAYSLLNEVDEMGYGGQAGGGKSDLALGAAGTVFRRSLILRREFPQLRKLIERGDEIYPETFVGNPKSAWRFGDRVITLGSVQFEKNWTKYQGWDVELLAVDEAAEMPEMAIRKISGWLRSSKGQHTLLLLLFNPPTTPEGEWIVRKFAPWVDPEYKGEPAESGEIRYFVLLKDETEIEVENDQPYTDFDGETYLPIRRTFIKASRHDNPYLTAEYERRLNALPEPLRSQVKDGDFTVGMKDGDWQVIPTNWVLAAQERWNTTPKPKVKLRAVGVDPAHGGNDNTAIAKLYGNWFDEILSYPGIETPLGIDTARLVLDTMESAAVIGIDAVGYGASAAEQLEASPNLKVVKINAGSGSEKVDKSGKFGFANLRAEMIWKFREALDPESGEDICLPPSRRLRVQLCSMNYEIRGGKYFIEPKVKIKERTGQSPDDAEAVIHAWYVAEAKPSQGMVKAETRGLYSGNRRMSGGLYNRGGRSRYSND
jgi:N-acetylmuramoyl-L-alanine amidase